MTPILSIAVNTFREAVRNRIFFSLIFFAVALLGIVLALSSASLNEEIRLMTDVGLFLCSTAAVFIAIFTGVNLVYKELERKTIYTIMSKPISRGQFICGKYLGLVQTMFVLVAVMGSVLCGVLYMVGWVPHVSMAIAIYLLFLEVTIVVSVAILFSSFSTPFLSGLMTLGVFIVGRFVDTLRQLKLGRSDADQESMEGISQLVRWIAEVAPDLSLYNVTPQIVFQRPIDNAFVYEASVVALTYVLICLGLAIFFFSRRDFT